VTDRVHDIAARGFASAAEAYERARPDYPAEAVDRLIQELEMTRAATVLDLAAGTGKLATALVPTGARLVGVEPVEPMRTRCQAALGDAGWVVGGVAEAIPFRDGTFDAVVVAQAFHWFDGPAALGEIHRVLKPAGRLGLLFNMRDESEPWVRRMTELIRPHERGAPQERTGEWRQAFVTTDHFGTLHQLRFQHRQVLDRQGLVDRVASISYIATLPDVEREVVLADARRLADDLGDEIVLPYVTELHWTSKV
jgi:SAM-dependent methyltransferase